jgi:hypothetical protein
MLYGDIVPMSLVLYHWSLLQRFLLLETISESIFLMFFIYNYLQELKV